MSRFEEIHPSKLAAFADGALTTLVFVWCFSMFRKAWKS